ncbi:hypothetical protein RUND412_008528 [Rhizina undulata]
MATIYPRGARSRTKIPDAWDDDDWDKAVDVTSLPTSNDPQKSSPPSAAPQILFKPPQVVTVTPPSGPRLLHPNEDTFASLYGNPQPKTFYKPELKILKRGSANPSPERPAPAKTPNNEETEKERRERERKEKERRYKEARDKIFGDASTSTSTSTTPPTATTDAISDGGASRSGTNSPPPTAPAKGKKQKNNNVKHKPPNSSGTPTRNSSTRSKKSSSPPSQKSEPKQMKLAPSGAITSISLNGGEFTVPAPLQPNVGGSAWYKRELDGKLLESQARALQGEEEEVLEGCPEGLDWDSFKRDTVPTYVPQQQYPGWNEYSRFGAVAGTGGYEDYLLQQPQGGWEYNPMFSARGTRGQVANGMNQEQPYIYPAVIDEGFVPREKETERDREKAPRDSGKLRDPRGPDTNGGRGFGTFRGRGRGRGGGDIVEGMSRVGLGDGVREFVPGNGAWGK